MTFATLRATQAVSRALDLTTACRARRMRRLLRHIFLPATAVMVSLFTSAAIGVSDTMLAGKMGTAALAAMSFCEPLWFLLALLTAGISSGVSVGLARRLKADPGKRQAFLLDSLILSALLGLLLSIGAFSLSWLLHLKPLWLSGTAPLVSKYFQTCAFSNFPYSIMQAQCAAFRASGKSRAVLMVSGTAAVIEIALSNYLFLQFRTCGLDTLAATWTVGCYIAVSIGFLILAPAFSNFSFDGYFKERASEHILSVVEVMKIGLPIALGELGIYCGGFLNLQIISSLSDARCFEAVWTIKTRIEEIFEIVPVCAVGFTTAPFVGRYFHGRSKRASQMAMSLSLDAAVVTGIVLIVSVFALQLLIPRLVNQFATDPLVCVRASRIVAVSAIAWPFFAVAHVFFAMMEGAGKTLIPSVINLICVLPLRLGLIMILKNCSLLSGIDGLTISGVLAQITLTMAAGVMVALMCRACMRQR